MAIASATTVSATISAPREPTITREKTSRPRLSVPNQNSADGGFSRSIRLPSYTASALGMRRGEKIAMKHTAAIMMSPSTAGTSRRNFFRMSMRAYRFSATRGSSIACTTSTTMFTSA
jgi:hypothetical protein